MSGRLQLPSLALIHDEDSFSIDLTEIGTKCVKILRIIRYPSNKNVVPTEERFFDFDSETRAAIMAQIRRRYRDKTIIT